MKKRFLVIIWGLLLMGTLHADEGMWLPFLIKRLNYVDLQKQGLQLTPEEIYSINHSSLKDAIVSINDGMCTGFLVSKEGLMMTNHHCILQYLTDNSIKYNTDYVQNGFWALDKKQELYNPNLKVTFLIRVEDVTDKILPLLNETMSPLDKKKKIQEISQKLVEDAVKGTDYWAEVKGFYKDNEFYLFVYETFKDVRLVGAPPMAIGNFGADTDNWMWPRHTGDFAFLRIYMGPDGRPAPYDKRKNIPYVPKYYLPISLKGYHEGDFTMVLGYPGITDRFASSKAISLATQIINPSIVKIRDAKLRIMAEAMKNDPSIELMYRSKYNKTSNYWKYYIGQTEILQRIKAYEKKKAFEAELTNWINADPNRKKMFSNALSQVNNALEEVSIYRKALIYYREIVFRGAEIISFANEFDTLYTILQDKQLPDDKRTALIADITTKLKYRASNYFFNSYNADLDKKIFVALFRIMKDDLPSQFYPSFFSDVESKYKDNFQTYADAIYQKSIFPYKDLVYEFLREPALKKLEKDPIFMVMKSVNDKYKQIKNEADAIEAKVASAEHLYMKAIRQYYEGKKVLYPDANSTMRISFGKVSSYTPTDGKETPFFTTLDEVIAKENPNIPDFIVPLKLKELYEKKDFGSYADKDGKIHVCFLTSDDITGGNSGAPVLNGKGEVIGIAFDINWEATASSLYYLPNQTRSIATDIRYALFVVEKYAEATNILQELDIRK